VGSTVERSIISPVKDLLGEILKEGARKLLVQAIESEVNEYIMQHSNEVDGNGHRLVVRNGYMPERVIQSGLGPIPVKRPRVNDKRVGPDGERMRFASAILPAYLRRTKAIDDLIPWLYLRGISTGDFPQALEALVGPSAKGFSANTVQRLCQIWQDDFREWERRRLDGKRFVYLWADGVYFKIRLGQGERQCVLVVIGVLEDGTKELLAMTAGVRESKESWRELLLDLKSRGLVDAPSLATGDGAMGFWSALSEVFPTTKSQRCWVHKTANVLDKLPKKKQPDSKADLHEIWMAETRDDAEKAFDAFIRKHEAKYPKATHCLSKDREDLLAFYDFPAEHWKSIRSTNPIESTFATVRLRTYRTKGPGNAEAGLAMAFKLMMCAQEKWRKINGSEKVIEVSQGVVFEDGIRKAA
jgi:transposase-like protein